MTKDTRRIELQVTCKIVTTERQFQDALAILSLVFMEEKGFSRDIIFDGNDFVATHVVFYDGVDPIGCSRIRWFADFAKIERTCLLSEYRNNAVLKQVGRFIFAHVAEKGYTKLITHADASYSRLWIKLYGFERVPNRPAIEAPGIKPHYELIKHLVPPDHAVTLASPPQILSRTEGSWDAPSSIG